MVEKAVALESGQTGHISFNRKRYKLLAFDYKPEDGNLMTIIIAPQSLENALEKSSKGFTKAGKAVNIDERIYGYVNGALVEKEDVSEIVKELRARE